MHRLSMAITALTIMSAAGCSNREPPTACDRACLIEIADGYLAAIAAHEPGAIPLSTEVAFVENITAMKPGEGLWASAAGSGRRFRINVPDPDQGTIGFMTVIERRTAERVAPALLAARLKIENRTITEAEHVIADVPREADPTRLEAPRPGLTALVPERERMSRQMLAAIASSYYDALVASDGSRAPFADDCEREENGMIAAGPGLPPAPFDSVDVQGRRPPPVARDCAGQMSSRRFAYIDSIDDRRVFAVDPVQGLAMGLSHFRQSMTRGPQLMIAADGSRVMWEEKREPYDLPAAHIFKISNGRIHEVEAIGVFVPYGAPTGGKR